MNATPRPAGAASSPTHDLPLRAAPPETTEIAAARAAPLFPARSFLDTFLARGVSRNNAPSTSRVLNPINHVPRPTRVNVQRDEVLARASGEVEPREARTLLTLPEQRRSRQHSPSSPIIEHSPQLDPGDGRTSIGLPSNHQRSPLVTPSAVADMVESEKAQEGVRAPGRAHVPTSKYNMRERDMEAGMLPQSQSMLGQNYGLSRDDQPLQPPRRVTSINSLRHQRSLLSLRSGSFAATGHNVPPPASVEGAATEREDHASVGEELAWGPSHPCYPHLNPHVPLNSAEYKETRIVRVRRDWMVKGDLAPTYSNLYPEILDPLLAEQEFRNIVQHVNNTLIEAFDPFSTWNWVDGILGLATGWLWEDFRPGGVKGKLRKLETWLVEWNRTVGCREGVKIVPLRRTGYMSLDIQIPDPHIQLVNRDGEEGSRGGSRAGE